MMEIGDKVVCVDKSKRRLYFGETYTIQKIVRDIWGDDIIHLEGINEGFFFWRFCSLEELQNENFIRIAKEKTS